MEIIIWENILPEIEQNIGSEAFEGWIKPLKFETNNDFSLYLTAPSLFIKNWIINNYKDLILDIVKKQYPKIASLEIKVKSSSSTASSNNVSLLNNNSNLPSNEISSFKDKEGTIGFKLDPNYTFDTFVVGKPNELAYAAAKRIAEDSQANFNPLFIYGGVGLGKTHLMHSIAWYLKNNKPSRKFLYLSAEKFMHLFIRALRDKEIINFKEIFRSTDVLMIDDFQFISGKDQTQEEFFHSFNSLIEQGKQIVFSADKSPSELDKIESRIVSRLNAGLVVDVHSTTYELRIGILQSKIKQMKVKVPEDVIEFLAHSITSNVRELEGALKRIIARHQLIGKKIDIEMASTAIEDIIKCNDKVISIDQIQKTVAEHFNIKFSDIISAKRSKEIAHARQIAMYLAKKETSFSYPEIGRKFGGKDHTTVLYAFNKIETERKKNLELEKELILLTKIIKNS